MPYISRSAGQRVLAALTCLGTLGGKGIDLIHEDDAGPFLHAGALGLGLFLYGRVQVALLPRQHGGRHVILGRALLRCVRTGSFPCALHGTHAH